MKTWLRRTLIGGTVVVALGAAAALAAVQLGERKAQRRIALAPYALALNDDAASVERGRYLFASRGCAECHGSAANGNVVIDDAGGFYVKSPAIGPGPGSMTTAYRPEDWDRSIRHGVRPDGRPLLIMPSEDYNRWTDADLAAVVAYLKQMPPAPGTAAVVRMPALLQALYGTGVIEDAAEKIDHRLPPSKPVAEGVTVEHGAYVANMCMGCHGAGLSGGKIPGGPPDWPPAANLTPGAGSAMGQYADAGQFMRMLRSGKRPDGSAVSEVMPFPTLGQLSDTDAAALYTYLRSVAPRPHGQR